MPHWYGVIQTGSPPIIESCKGDARCIREKIMEHAPQGANVRSIVWFRGKNAAAVTVEGPAARDYLNELEAQDVVELEVSAPLDR
jgi:hypothetical protein